MFSSDERAIPRALPVVVSKLLISTGLVPSVKSKIRMPESPSARYAVFPSVDNTTSREVPDVSIEPTTSAENPKPTNSPATGGLTKL